MAGYQWAGECAEQERGVYPRETGTTGRPAHRHNPLLVMELSRSAPAPSVQRSGRGRGYGGGGAAFQSCNCFLTYSAFGVNG
jgi:hypothetical protein